MKWLLGILAVVVLGAAVYFSIALSPAAGPAVNFTPNGSSTPSFPLSPKSGATGGKTSGMTGGKSNSGYTVSTHGKTETITSTAAGVSLDAPVNTVIAQTNAVLSVTPPESTAGENVSVQKSTGSYPDASGLSAALTGTDIVFNALRTTPDSSEYNPNNSVHSYHIWKLNNLTVDGHPAVRVRVTTSSPSRDFYLVWARWNITNWYITRSSIGLTPAASSALDAIVSSVRLLP